MKKLLQLFITSAALFGVFFVTINAKKPVSVNRINTQKEVIPKTTGDVITLDVSYTKGNGSITINDRNVSSFTAYDERTGISLPVFIVPNHTIDHGWGFYGDCLVYGTFYIGDNGVELFVPCGLGCTGFHDICPPDGEGLCRISFGK